MNIAIVGSTHFRNKKYIHNLIFALLQKHPGSTIMTDGAEGVGECVLDITIENNINLYRCSLKEIPAWADAFVTLYKPGEKRLDDWMLRIKRKRKPTWTIPIEHRRLIRAAC